MLAPSESVLEQQAPDDLPPGTSSADEDTEHDKFSSSPWDDDANETGPLARAAAGQGSGSAALHLSPLATAAALPLTAPLIQENLILNIYSVADYRPEDWHHIPEDAKYIDVTMFRDPKSDYKVREHSGKDATIVKRFVEHNKGRSFRQLMKKFVELIQNYIRDNVDCLDGNLKPLSICFWCNRGKHRSVAAAHLAVQVCPFSLDDDGNRRKTEHVSQHCENTDHWRSNCPCGNDSDGAAAPIEAREAYLAARREYDEW